jgi:hypothetical protein
VKAAVRLGYTTIKEVLLSTGLVSSAWRAQLDAQHDARVQERLDAMRAAQAQ